MGIDIVRGVIKNTTATEILIQSIEKSEKSLHLNGTLYLGYPLNATTDSVVSVDALLVCKEKGLVAFVFNENGSNDEDAQDLLYFQFQNALTKYESLRKGRDLAVKPKIISFYPVQAIPDSNEIYTYCNSNTLENVLRMIPDFDVTLYTVLCESLQKISSMKPKKKRTAVSKQDSYGGIIKKIEAEIANLDEWQKKAAFEVPDGPQRIRGLAGSGKTVVLALKAAYLHSQHPEWNIAVTFYTRSLSQQYKEMITNFTYEFMGEQPNWDKLQILHAWGTTSEPGIYSEIAKRKNIIPKNYANAKSQYGVQRAFQGICEELQHFNGKEMEPIYDVILIDEAQDMPAAFFRLCYDAVKYPKRIVFAYDELQSLNSSAMPSISEMFGTDKEGNAIVSLSNHEDESRQDIVLPVCYRNTPWALTLAHSLGFGIYRKAGIVQLFDDLSLWDSIGYKVTDGSLQFGKDVQLVRKESSYPKYFTELLEPQDAVMINRFQSAYEQYQWVAEQIEKDIKTNELDPDDILVIFPEAYYSKSQYHEFEKFLIQRGIDSILAGVNADRDTFRVENCITCSSIYRAKGNEAPMVYIVNADYCAKGTEMITLRNTLFTAITRSRAWVRICGVLPDIEIIENEVKTCINHNFGLRFRMPTKKELESQRLLYRDRTEKEKKKIKEATDAIKFITESYEKGEIDLEEVPELNKLFNIVKKTEDSEGDYE